MSSPRVVKAADVALYTSRTTVWKVEEEALKNFFDQMGWSYELVTATQINTGYLGHGAARKFRALVMPGGYVGQRTMEFNESGVQAMRRFVESGGGYLGICAGAAMAASGFEVALDTRSKSGVHAPTDYFPMRYRMLGLWPGNARSPYEWAPYLRGATTETVDLTEAAPVPRESVLAVPISRESMSATRDRTDDRPIALESKMFYLAGPSLRMDFELRKTPPDFEIWGFARAPISLAPNLNSEKSAHGQPSILKFSFGQGAVVLFAQHPVILLENSGSANITNWHLLHAALQTVTRSPLIALTRAELITRLIRTRARLYTCEALFRPAI